MLESNGSISNYIATNGTFDVLLSTATPYSLQSILYNGTGSNTVVSVNGTTYVSLPKNLQLLYKAQSVPVSTPPENFSVSVTPVRPVGASITVKIQALVTGTGQVYNNQIKVTPV